MVRNEHPTSADIVSVAIGAKTIVGAMPELAVAYGALIDGTWHRFSTSSFLRCLEMSEDDFTRLPLEELMDASARERLNAWHDLTPAERKTPFRFLALRKGHVGRWLELHMSRVGSVEAPNPSEPNFYILHDIDSEVRLTEQNRRIMNRQDAQLGVLSSALNASRDGFAIWKAVRDHSGTITSFILSFINDAGAAPTGKMPRTLLGHAIEDVLGETESEDLSNLFTRALELHEVQSETVQLETTAGWVGAYQNQVVPFTDDQVLASFRDVSEDQRERDRLNWLAEHDQLTGLPNRRNLEELLQKALSHVRGSTSFVAFAFVDIDNFKHVNDTRGHDVGDVLLSAFAQRLREIVGDDGVVARLAGDEFAVLIDDVASADQLTVTFDNMISSMNQPFENAPPPIVVTCSAGIALCAGEEPTSEVLRIADKAMYRAKHDGRNRYNIVHI